MRWGLPVSRSAWVSCCRPGSRRSSASTASRPCWTSRDGPKRSASTPCGRATRSSRAPASTPSWCSPPWARRRDGCSSAPRPSPRRCATRSSPRAWSAVWTTSVRAGLSSAWGRGSRDRRPRRKQPPWAPPRSTGPARPPEPNCWTRPPRCGGRPGAAPGPARPTASRAVTGRRMAWTGWSAPPRPTGRRCGSPPTTPPRCSNGRPASTTDGCRSSPRPRPTAAPGDALRTSAGARAAGRARSPRPCI